MSDSSSTFLLSFGTPSASGSWFYGGTFSPPRPWIYSCVVLLLCHVIAASELDVVTCGSALKLKNVKFNVRLHSHDVKYGSGSGQQSVTAVEDVGDNNSYWQVKGKQGTICTRGQPIKCGSKIRLMHLRTRRNLHSHAYTSHLSEGQEVSAHGEDSVGDHGDDWAVTCTTSTWKRDAEVRFKHVQTEVYLAVSGAMYGRPIHGHLEVKGDGAKGYNTVWKSAEGVFVKPTEVDDTSRDSRETDDAATRKTHDPEEF